jgi:hypothetical protein
MTQDGNLLHFDVIGYQPTVFYLPLNKNLSSDTAKCDFKKLHMENSYSYIGYANFSDGSDPANSNSGRNA